MRGGLAQVKVLTSMFFGGMIGSSTAKLADDPLFVGGSTSRETEK
jgi:TRAP-type C4-dicarboxylate transport system permease large subunit